MDWGEDDSSLFKKDNRQSAGTDNDPKNMSVTQTHGTNEHKATQGNFSLWFLLVIL